MQGHEGVEGLEAVTSEESLEEMGLFSLEKAQADVIKCLIT